MALYKHEIPILEYDDNPTAVLSPDHEKLGLHLPEICVFAFLGEAIDRYALEQGAVRLGEFVTVSQIIPVYQLSHNGKEIALAQAPVGAAASAEMLDWLIAYGVKKVICAGSCGALIHLPENVFLVPQKALRDEGTSYHYLPPSRYVYLNEQMQQKIKAVFDRKGIPYITCTTWSTDGIYRETADFVAYRREEGCAVVEMECAALTACAQFRGIDFGQFIYTADSLANVNDYDERDWGEDSVLPALLLCLEIAAEM